jgi:hypothetical protein
MSGILGNLLEFLDYRVYLFDTYNVTEIYQYLGIKGEEITEMKPLLDIYPTQSTKPPQPPTGLSIDK